MHYIKEIDMSKEQDINIDRVEKLSDHILNLVEEFSDEHHAHYTSVSIADGEILVALMDVIGKVVANINCRGCRKVKAKAVRDYMRSLLREAVSNPANSDSSGEAHVH
jgi:hypothetical protein